MIQNHKKIINLKKKIKNLQKHFLNKKTNTLLN